MTRDSFIPFHTEGYDIDPQNGFLPSEEPLRRLNGDHELFWEQLLDETSIIPLRFSGGHNISEQEERNARMWRSRIRGMPILVISRKQLKDSRYIRRARVVLSFLAHFYIHSQPVPVSPVLSKNESSNDDFNDQTLEAEEKRGKYKTTIPASIANPWCTVSKILQLPPILTYADTVLWNWHLISPKKGIQGDNLSITTTFSSTPTEEHFFKTSLLIELQGAQALKLIQQTIISINYQELLLQHNLQELTKIIEKMVKIFVNITSACIPSVFYWDVRTWFNGSDTSPITYNQDGSILQEARKGWTFQGKQDSIKLLTGPSAGQSSVIHALDIFLGVDHSSKISKGQTESFMQRMQKFMPGPHSHFLTHLNNYLYGTIPMTSLDCNVNSKKRSHLIQAISSSYPNNYNEAVKMLCKLRDQHMRIVALYILIPAREPPPHHHTPLDETIRVQSREDDKHSKAERGTGGTELVTFLKGTRDRTRQALIIPGKT